MIESQLVNLFRPVSKLKTNMRAPMPAARISVIEDPWGCSLAGKHTSRESEELEDTPQAHARATASATEGDATTAPTEGDADNAGATCHGKSVKLSKESIARAPFAKSLKSLGRE